VSCSSSLTKKPDLGCSKTLATLIISAGSTFAISVISEIDTGRDRPLFSEPRSVSDLNIISQSFLSSMHL
jgi:hypothetical protein